MHQGQKMERPVVAGAEAGPPEGWHRRRRTARRRYATSLARRSGLRARARARSSWGPRAKPERMPMGAGRLGKWWLAHHPSPPPPPPNLWTTTRAPMAFAAFAIVIDESIYDSLMVIREGLFSCVRALLVAPSAVS